MTKRDQILAILRRSPGMRPEHIAERIGCGVHYARRIRHHATLEGIAVDLRLDPLAESARLLRAAGHVE